MLLGLAATQFDVFITVDKDLPREQDLSKFDIAVIVLRARTTRLIDLRELFGSLHETLRTVRRRELRVLSWRDMR